MRIADFNADAGVITVRESKAGKPRHVVLTEEGQRLFASLTVGKLGSDPIFTRNDGGLWGKSHQLPPMLEACKRAKINPAISFHVLRHTHGSTLAMRGVSNRPDPPIDLLHSRRDPQSTRRGIIPTTTQKKAPVVPGLQSHEKNP
jgi:integrase